MSALLPAHEASLAQLQAHCAALAGATPAPPLQDTVAWLRADLETDLFPALCVAMAGSDAVCIREMRERLLAQLDALARPWPAPHGVLPRGGADGRCADLATPCRAIVDFENRELLPMAARLLDDAALADLRAAMDARRAA